MAGSCAIESLAGLYATHPGNPGNVAGLAEVCCPAPCCAGAEVQRLRPVSITHPEHPVNVARRRASEVPGAVFADQFENLANLRAHLDTGVCQCASTSFMSQTKLLLPSALCAAPLLPGTVLLLPSCTSCSVLTLSASAPACPTGREILQQTQGRLHAFVSGAGTGGTVAGVSQALKTHNPSIQVVLADPQGSSLFNKVGRSVVGGACGALVCMHARLSQGSVVRCCSELPAWCWGWSSLACSPRQLEYATRVVVYCPLRTSTYLEAIHLALLSHMHSATTRVIARGVWCRFAQQHVFFISALGLRLALLPCRSSGVCSTPGTKPRASGSKTPLTRSQRAWA